MPKKDPNRILLLNNLRKKGDYIYNSNTENQIGHIVCKESLSLSKRKNVCCPECFGFYSKYSIRNHIRFCHSEKYKTNKRLTIQSECKKLENNISHIASNELRMNIFPYMRDDQVSNIIQNDQAVFGMEIISAENIFLNIILLKLDPILGVLVN